MKLRIAWVILRTFKLALVNRKSNLWRTTRIGMNAKTAQGRPHINEISIVLKSVFASETLKLGIIWVSSIAKILVPKRYTNI